MTEHQPKDKSLGLLREQLNAIGELKRVHHDDPAFDKWWQKTRSIVSNIFGQDSHQLEQFVGIQYGLMAFTSDTPDSSWQQAYVDGLNNAEAHLEALIAEIENFWQDEAVKSPLATPRSDLERLFDRFHLVVRQLRSRHADRETLDVSDEYDVQDLLHALLKLHFDDVRSEEWTPSYAGGASRMDFLLHEHRMVIEVKCSRPSMKSKDVGAELSIDIMRYKAHPNVSTLFCFIYDPAGHLANPVGIERDLNRDHDGLEVRCYIRPR